MSLKNKMKHVLQYKEGSVISEISNLTIISQKLWKQFYSNNDVLTWVTEIVYNRSNNVIINQF